MTLGRARTRGAVVALAAGLLGLLALTGCGGSAGGTGTSGVPVSSHGSAPPAKVTFIELGADKCIPCKEMRPVMAGIEKTFGDQVDVVFYDVWKDPAPANEYGVQMIPTQVFLDETGAEFHRHVGFYPQEDIEALLVERGLEKIATP